MWKRFSGWLVRYSPSIILILEMALLYWAALSLLFHVMWPNAYLNAEPVQSVLTAAADRMAERAAFRANLQNALIWMGIAALILYLIYSANGALHMSHDAHVKFSKRFRGATHSCYFVLMVNVCADYFVLPWANQGWVWLRSGLTVLGILFYLGFLIGMGAGYLKNQSTERYKSAYLPAISLLFSVAFATFMKTFDGIGMALRDIWQYIFLHRASPQVSLPNTYYVLSQPVDYLLPLTLLFLWLLLYLAMKFASPLAANTSEGGRIYSAVKL